MSVKESISKKIANRKNKKEQSNMAKQAAPKVNISKEDAPKVNVPKENIAKVNTPKVETPRVSVPEAGAKKRSAGKKSLIDKFKELDRVSRRAIIIVASVVLVALIAVVTVYIVVHSDPNPAGGVTLSEKESEKKFASEYNEVSGDNIFVYRSAEEIINILKHGTGLVYFGFPSCQWCQRYASYLNEVAKEQGVEKIFYYDIQKDRQDNTEAYQEMVSILSDVLQYDDEGNRRIYVPDVVFVTEGAIVGNDFETSKDTEEAENPDAYWTPERVAALKARLVDYIQRVNEGPGCMDACNN